MKQQRQSNEILAPGDTVGRYQIVRKISQGGFGVVYLALRDDGYEVAIKEFLPSMIACRVGTKKKIKCDSENDHHRFQEGLKAFFREADMLAQVHNSRIIPIWDVFKENGTAYFAMPLEKGGTLQSLLKWKSIPLSEQEMRSIFVDACKGVEALHAKGLLHLDIKPSNLWVRPDRSVLLLDLGASRWEDEEIQTSQLARTPGFAAPEQHHQFKEKGLSPLTDIYGLCASFLSCLIKGPPIAAPLRQVGALPVTWSQVGQASSDLLRVLNKGMSMQPQLRHKSVMALRADFENIPRLATDDRWKESLSLSSWDVKHPFISDSK